MRSPGRGRKVLQRTNPMYHRNREKPEGLELSRDKRAGKIEVGGEQGQRTQGFMSCVKSLGAYSKYSENLLSVLG